MFFRFAWPPLAKAASASTTPQNKHRARQDEVNEKEVQAPPKPHKFQKERNWWGPTLKRLNRIAHETKAPLQ